MLTIVIRPNYFVRAGDALSQVANVLLFNGNSNESISGRAARTVMFEEQDPWLWKGLYYGINGFFFWQPNHCVAAYLSDVVRAHYTVQRGADYLEMVWTNEEEFDLEFSN